jgi:glycosyltransferase involved in cell wall biosynthesis
VSRGPRYTSCHIDDCGGEEILNPERRRISVVIPLYNKQAYVERAVASVLQSAYPAHEVIVIDDGSTDDGPQRVSAMGDPRVRLIRQPNGGVSAARNRGISAARGDYVAFLDADDYWTPQYLSAIADLIARFPQCGLHATHFYHFRDDGFRQVPRLWGIKADARPQQIEQFFEIWSHAIFFCTSSVVIPMRILRDSGIRFPEGEQHGEDQDVWFRIAERWPIGYLGQPLVGYRVGVPGSLASSFSEDFLPSYERLASRYRSNAIPEQHRKGVSRMLSLSRLVIARHLLLRGQRRRAIKLLYDPGCLRLPRFWVRLFLAAHMPAFLGRQLIP